MTSIKTGFVSLWVGSVKATSLQDAMAYFRHSYTPQGEVIASAFSRLWGLPIYEPGDCEVDWAQNGYTSAEAALEGFSYATSFREPAGNAISPKIKSSNLIACLYDCDFILAAGLVRETPDFGVLVHLGRFTYRR